MNENSISAVIIVKNEAERLPGCLESIKWVDEIIVVDDNSTDGTPEVIARFNAKIFTHKLNDFAESRNFAQMQASSKWILSIDADERITENLKNEILDKVNDPAEEAYSIPRKNIFLGKWLKYGGWYPDAQIRLFKAGKFKWSGATHETVAPCLRAAKMKHPLLHLTHKNIFEQVKKSNFYSGIEAAHCKGKRYQYWRILLSPGWEFIKRYFLLLGFMDGINGLIINILVSYYIFLSQAKKWEAKIDERYRN